MNFLDIRNRIVQGLSEYLDCPVVLNNQQNPEQDPPYVFYSALPYNPEAGNWGTTELSRMETPILSTGGRNQAAAFPLRSAAWTVRKVTSISWERMKPVSWP